MANPKGIGGQKAGEPSRNPKGRPAGYQSFVDRAKYWLEQKSAEEIITLLEDKAKARKLGAYDYMILHRIAEAFTAGGRKSMDSLLDRLLGKPPQHITQTIDAEVMTVSEEERKRQAEKEAEELLEAMPRTGDDRPTVH